MGHHIRSDLVDNNAVSKGDYFIVKIDDGLGHDEQWARTYWKFSTVTALQTYNSSARQSKQRKKRVMYRVSSVDVRGFYPASFQRHHEDDLVYLARLPQDLRWQNRKAIPLFKSVTASSRVLRVSTSFTVVHSLQSTSEVL